MTPTLRLRCRSGVFHCRAAPPTSLRPLGCPLAQSRPPADVEARPSPGSTPHMLRHPLHVLWPRAGSSPAAVLVLYVALSQYFDYASSFSLSSGATWRIPGGDNGRDEVHHRQGVLYPHGRLEAHQRHPRPGAFAPLDFSLSDEAEKSATHSGSAQGAFRGLVFCLASSCGFLLCFLPLLASLGCCVFGAVRTCFGFGFRVSFPTALLLGELMTRIETAPQLMEIASRLLIKGRSPTRALSSPRHLG